MILEQHIFNTAEPWIHNFERNGFIDIIKAYVALTVNHIFTNNVT